MFWEIYKFTETYTQGYITFYKGDEIVLVHKDTKYEHTFACSVVRGVITFPHKIFEKLEIVTAEYAEYFKKIT